MSEYRYVFQMRRGWKYDSDPETGEPRDDWAKYTAEKPDVAIPLPGELVLEYDNGIPRLKIGDGKHTFAELEYMSVDSFILPKPITIKLNGGLAIEDNPSGWTQMSGDRFIQEVTTQLAGKITPNSKVDLQPTPEQLCAFHEKDVAFTTVNEDGRIYVYAIGTMPQNTYENIQVTITEVDTNG